jgi:hypothetical protein
MRITQEKHEQGGNMADSPGVRSQKKMVWGTRTRLYCSHLNSIQLNFRLLSFYPYYIQQNPFMRELILLQLKKGTFWFNQIFLQDDWQITNDPLM